MVGLGVHPLFHHQVMQLDTSHRFRQAIGPVNAGVQEDWTVELAPGEYVLALTLGGDSEVLLSVR